MPKKLHENFDIEETKSGWELRWEGKLVGTYGTFDQARNDGFFASTFYRKHLALPPDLRPS